MLWEFKNNQNDTEIVKKIPSVYGQGVILDYQVHKCFPKFRSGETSLRNASSAGCSSDLDQNAWRELVECNPCKRTWELALDLNTSQSTICCHLKKIRKVCKLGVCDLHTFSGKNKVWFGISTFVGYLMPKPFSKKNSSGTI